MIDFQTIAEKTLLAFLAGYLTPKIADFDNQKLKTSDMTKPHENVYLGLEPCALALGSLENTPGRLAAILEQHHIKTKAACPGTDEDLLQLLKDTRGKPYFEFYRTTIDQQVQKEWNTNLDFTRLLRGEMPKFSTRCIEVVTQWKVQCAHKKKNLLHINHHNYELGGKVSSLKAAGKSGKGTVYPFFPMIDLLVEVLGDSPEDSPLDRDHWVLMNEIVYNEIPQFPNRLINTKDHHRMKRILLEIMRLFVLYGAQDASLTHFIAKGLAIITSELPTPSKITDPLWCFLFQKDILDLMQRPIISCPEIPLEKGLEVTSEDRKKIRELINLLGGNIYKFAQN
ncbi:MAG: hypothetical protein GY861_11940 [bacterium]|nr:hypothetical protein [bacterium]